MFSCLKAFVISQRSNVKAAKDPRKKVFYLVRMMICVALLAYILVKYDTTSIFLRLRNAQFHWLALSCVFLYVGVLLCSLRWRTILRSHARQDSVLRLFSLYIEASFFNLFFPGFVAGDASRIARTSSHGKHPFEAFFAVFIDRFSGFFTTVLYIGCVALLGGYDSLGKVWSDTILLALALALTGLLALSNVQLVRRVVRFLPHFLGHQMEKLASQLREAVGTLTSRPDVLWQVAIFSILYVFALVPPAYLAARSIDLQIPLTVLLAYVPLTAFVCSLPISIVGVGVRENVYVLVYSAAGFAPEDIIAFGLVFSGLVLIINLTGGVLLLLRAVLPK